MIERDKIKDKLLAFYEGKTSREDERALYVYFLTEAELPEELEDERDMFMSLFESDKGDEIAIPSNLEGDLHRLIDRMGENEAKGASRHKRRRLLWVGGVAASLILGLFLGGKHLDMFSDNEKVEYVVERDTFTDPQDAYNATEGALYYTSAKLNKVFERMEKSSDKK